MLKLQHPKQLRLLLILYQLPVPLHLLILTVVYLIIEPQRHVLAEADMNLPDVDVVHVVDEFFLADQEVAVGQEEDGAEVSLKLFL